VTDKSVKVLGGGSALACMSVRRAKDGSFDHYYSLDFIPPWKSACRRYRSNFRAHIKDQPAGRVWVECPNHPIPFRRARRRYA